MHRKHPLSLLIAGLLALTLGNAAHADSDSGSEHMGTGSSGNSGNSSTAGDDQIAEHSSSGTDVEHVASMVGGTNTSVSMTQDGHYEIGLPDGSTVAVTPQGNTKVHSMSTGVTSTSVDADGHLHVQTGDGYEMTVGSAQHSETETEHVLTQNGLKNVTSTGNRISGMRQDGSVISMEADYQVNHGQATGTGQYVEDSTGADIVYPDGTRQHYHGSSPDTTQLRAAAQAMGYSVSFNSDGSAKASSAGGNHLVKFSPRLTQGSTTQPGLRMQNGKVLMQYQNGLEQEVIVVQ